jgi:hypothetical protein
MDTKIYQLLTLLNHSMNKKETNLGEKTFKILNEFKNYTKNIEKINAFSQKR